MQWSPLKIARAAEASNNLRGHVAASNAPLSNGQENSRRPPLEKWGDQDVSPLPPLRKGG